MHHRCSLRFLQGDTIGLPSWILTGQESFCSESSETFKLRTKSRENPYVSADPWDLARHEGRGPAGPLHQKG